MLDFVSGWKVSGGRRDVLERDEEECCQKTRANNRAVGEQVERNERLARNPFFVDGEGNKADASDDKHGDDGGRTPASALVVCQGDGKKNQGKGCNDEKETNYCIIGLAAVERIVCPVTYHQIPKTSEKHSPRMFDHSFPEPAIHA